MRVNKSRQQRMPSTNDVLPRFEARAHLRRGSEGDDPAFCHRDSMIREDGVDRCDRQHPAGFYEEIYGFQGYCASSAKKMALTPNMSSISGRVAPCLKGGHDTSVSRARVLRFAFPPSLCGHVF